MRYKGFKQQSKKFRYLIGVDEVGRGPIAGPVAVGAFIFLKSNQSEQIKKIKKIFRGVRESKQLLEVQREEWFGKIKVARALGLVDFAVTFMSEKNVDKIGIAVCIRRALESSLKKLVKKHAVDVENNTKCLVLLDGGLRAPVHFKNQKTIIKGDAKEQVIALASICAKVMRDRRMRKYAKTYPKYAFDVHKGYGTRSHYAAIRLFGLTPLHRRSFLTRLTLNPRTLANPQNMS